MSQRTLLSPGDLDAILPWSMIRAARKVTHLVTEALTPLDLAPVEFGVLSLLDVSGPLTQAELARMISVRPQSIAPAVRAMAERGLVIRPGAGGRGRPARLALTREGSALLERAFPVVAALNERFPGTTAGIGQANMFLLEYISV